MTKGIQTKKSQNFTKINRSARGVILGTRKKLLNDPTRRIINMVILGLALGFAHLSGGAGVGNVYAEGSEVVFGVTVPTTPVLQITLYDNNGDEMASGDTSTMSVTPQMANAAFNTSNISVNVGTSSIAGYNLTMYASNTSLISGDNEIPTLGEGSFTCTAEQSATNDEDCTFTENAWGYKLSTASSFGAIPAQASPALLNSNAAPTNGVTTTVNFGSRVNAQQPAGTYTTTINFIATANPTSISSIDQIEHLQDFANLTSDEKTAVLNSMTAETNYTKTDSRDGQEYTIAKLADNKIWMTKNLNLAGGTEIENTKSDVPEGYTLDTAYGFQSGNRLPASSTFVFDLDSETPDMWAYANNSSLTTCGNNSPCYSYYSWTAATAGSGANIFTKDVDAEYSICPKGWKLPNNRSGTDDSSDFRALMIAYGGSSSIYSYDASTSPTGATMYGKITINPLPSFLLTGFYSDGSLSSGGVNGLYWTSTSFSSKLSPDAYTLNFDSTSVSLAGGKWRRYGLAIRCVIK